MRAPRFWQVCLGKENSFLKKDLFVAVLSLRGCARLSLVEGSGGDSLEVVLGFCLRWSSRVVEQELQGVAQ